MTEQILNFFRPWKTLYIQRLEKENERLTQEVRHWQNQCLIGMRMQPLPVVAATVAGQALMPEGELKKVNMPQFKTHEQKKRDDFKTSDLTWASDVAATELELKRTRERMGGSAS